MEYDERIEKLKDLAFLKHVGREMKQIYMIRKNPVIGEYVKELYEYLTDFEF